MSYSDIVAMVQDWDLHLRLVACAAQEGAPGDALQFVDEHAWQICGGTGWEAAWVEAREKGIEPPIPDGMVRSGVRAVIDATAERARAAERAAAEAVAAGRKAERDQQLDLYRQQRELDLAGVAEPIAEPDPAPARRGRAKKESP